MAPGGASRVGVPAVWNDGSGTSGGDEVMAIAAADLLIGRDVIEQFGQHRRITDCAGGELGSPSFQCFLMIVGETVHWTDF